MKKAINQLKRSLFVGFILLSNLIFSISASQRDSFINDNSIFTKSLIIPEQNCGPWPNFETMIKKMKGASHTHALIVSINWYLMQNSYQEGKSDNGDIMGMWLGTKQDQ